MSTAKSYRKNLIVILFALVLIVLSFLITNPTFTGFLTLTPSQTQPDNVLYLNETFQATGSPHHLRLETDAAFTSLTLTGRISGEGNLSVLLVNGTQQWTLYEQKRLTDDAGNLLTGKVTKEQQVLAQDTNDSDDLDRLRSLEDVDSEKRDGFDDAAEEQVAQNSTEQSLVIPHNSQGRIGVITPVDEVEQNKEQESVDGRRGVVPPPNETLALNETLDKKGLQGNLSNETTTPFQPNTTDTKNPEDDIDENLEDERFNDDDSVHDDKYNISAGVSNETNADLNNSFENNETILSPIANQTNLTTPSDTTAFTPFTASVNLLEARNLTLVIEIQGSLELELAALHYSLLLPFRQYNTLGSASILVNETLELDLFDYFSGPPDMIFDIPSKEGLHASIEDERHLTLSAQEPGTYTLFVYALSGDELLRSNEFNLTVKERSNKTMNVSINDSLNFSGNGSLNASLNVSFNDSFNVSLNASLNATFNQTLNFSGNESLNVSFNASLVRVVGQAVVGQDVTFEQTVSALSNDTVVKVVVPRDARRVRLAGLLQERLSVQRVGQDVSLVVNRLGMASDDSSNLTAEEVLPVNYTVHYELPGPQATEKNLSKAQKQIDVVSTYHLENVLIRTRLPQPARRNEIKLEWLTVSEDIDQITYIDEDNDGFIEELEWLIPHLSNQSFLISLTVLNPVEYLKDGDEWNVYFNTTGTANLSITSPNAHWEEMLLDNPQTVDEMRYVELSCGDEPLDITLVDETGQAYTLSALPEQSAIKPVELFVQNYTCNQTATLTNYMNIAGYAVLEFNFSNQFMTVTDEAVDPSDFVPLSTTSVSKAMIMWVAEDGSYYFPKYATSDDGFDTWYEGHITTNADYETTYGADIDVGINKYGNAVMCMPDTSGTTSLGTWIYNGSTGRWDDYSEDGDLRSEFCSISVYNNETISISTDSSYDFYAPFYIHSSDAAKSWSSWGETKNTYDVDYDLLPKITYLSDGNALMVFKDDDALQYIYYLWNGTDWTDTGVVESQNLSIGPTGDLAALPNGEAFFAWGQDSGSEDPIFVRKWNGSAWEDRTLIDGNNNIVKAAGYNNNDPEISCGSSGYCMLVWMDTGDYLEYAYYNGSEWSSADQNVGSTNEEDAGWDVAVDSDGNALLIYTLEWTSPWPPYEYRFYTTIFNWSTKSWTGSSLFSTDIPTISDTNSYVNPVIKLFETDETIVSPNYPPSTPTNITCNGESCNQTFTGVVDIECSGSSDEESDSITYYLEKLNETSAVGLQEQVINFNSFESDFGDWTAGSGTVISISFASCGSQTVYFQSSEELYQTIDASDAEYLTISFVVYHSSIESADCLEVQCDGVKIKDYGESGCDVNEAERNYRNYTLNLTSSDCTLDDSIKISFKASHSSSADYSYIDCVNLTKTAESTIYSAELLGTHSETTNISWNMADDVYEEIYERLQCKASDIAGSQENTSYYTVDSNFTVNNALPVVTNVTIQPTSPLPDQDLQGYCTATDEELQSLTYYWMWYRNDVENESGSSGSIVSGTQYNVDNISSTLTSADENWTLSCTAYDGLQNSSASNYTETILFVNVPPELNSLSLSTENQKNYSSLDLNCSAVLIDNNSHDINLSVRWFNNSDTFSTVSFPGPYSNGTFFNTTLPNENTTVGENWSCALRLDDSFNRSDWYQSGNLTILANDLPQLTQLTISSSDEYNYSFNDLNCSAVLIDNNSDDINLSVRWFNNSDTFSTVFFPGPYSNGTFFNASLASSNIDIDDNWSCGVLLSDPYNDSEWYYTDNITIRGSLEIYEPSLLPFAPNVSSILSGYCNASDISSNSSPSGFDYRWYKNDVISINGTHFRPGSIASGSYHSCGIRANDSRILCWGQGSYGRLGDGYDSDRNTPTLINDTAAYLMVSPGNQHTCAVRANDSRVLCWGRNEFYGRLGTGDLVNRFNPTLINDTSAYTYVDTGGSTSCAIRANDSRILCWGYNNYGSLGDGSITNRHNPTLINDTSSYLWVSTSSTITCGVRTNDSRVLCWGTSTDGGLGAGEGVNESLNPQLINSTASFEKVIVSEYFKESACALRLNDSRLLCWGYGEDGNLGTGSAETEYSPLLVNTTDEFKDFEVGERHTCALRANDSLVLCWGYGIYGQVGDGLDTTRNNPVRINDSEPYQEVALGLYHSCGLREDGQVTCWGRGNYGQLGQGVDQDESNPTNISDSSAYLSSFTSYESILVDRIHPDELQVGQDWVFSCRAFEDGFVTDWVNSSSKSIYGQVSPNTPEVTLESTDGLDRTASTLNCSSTISDNNIDSLNVTLQWFKDGSLNRIDYFNNSYASGSFFNMTLASSNTTKGDDWSCRLRLDDSVNQSAWGSSSNLTIANTPPLTPDSLTPTSGTYESSIDFTCGGSSDVDPGDIVYYSFQSNKSILWSGFATNDPDGFYSWDISSFDEQANVDIRCAANDTDDISSWYNPAGTFNIDNDAPVNTSMSDNATGNILTGQTIQFNVTFTDLFLDTCTFEIDDGAGSFSNTTNESCLSATTWSLTRSVSATRGEVVNWSWYANDTLNHVTNTPYTSFVVQNTPPSDPTTLTPTTGNYSDPVTITCSGSSDADSDAVYYTIQSNRSGAWDALVSNDGDGVYDWSVSAYEQDFVDLRCVANDTFDNSSWFNPAGTILIDGLSPRLLSNATNASENYTDDVILFNATFNDTYLDTCIFEYYNGSQWSNTTNTSCTAEDVWEVTETITATAGMIINWSWYANDTLGNYKHSDYYSFVVQSENAEPVVQTSDIEPVIAYANTTLLGYCNATDGDGDNVTYYWEWYKNDELNLSDQTTHNFTQGVKINVANITSGNLTAGDEWLVSCQASDGIDNSTWVNSSSVEILNAPPSGTTVILNTSEGTNYSDENLTAFISSIYDVDNDEFSNITDWRLQGTSIAVLNLPFDTNESATSIGAVRDYSTHENNATLGGGTSDNAPTWTNSGKLGNAYDFDGNDYINSSEDALDMETAVSVAAWIYRKGDCVGSYAKIISKWENYFLATDCNAANDNYLYAGIHGSGWATTASGDRTLTVPVDEWHHVAMTYSEDSDLAIVYYDGEQIHNFSTSSITGSTYDLAIGTNYPSALNQNFNGTIDEVLVFDRELSPEQVRLLYNQTAQSRPLTTIHFEETSIGENWSVAVTPNDGYVDGETTLSNTLLLRERYLYVPLSNTTIDKAMVVWVSDDEDYGVGNTLPMFSFTTDGTSWNEHFVTRNFDIGADPSAIQTKLAFNHYGEGVLTTLLGNYLHIWDYNHTSGLWHDRDGDTDYYTSNGVASIDVLGPDVLMWGSRVHYEGPYYSYSSDAGATWSAWTQAELTYDVGTTMNMDVVYFENRDALAVFQDKATDDIRSMQWDASSQTWSSSILATDENTSSLGGFDLMAYPDSTAWLIWGGGSGEDYPVHVMFWNGTGWEGKTHLNISNNYISYAHPPTIGCGSQGRCIAVWDADGSDTRSRYSYYDGTSWSQATLFSYDHKFDGRPSVAVDSDGDALLCFVNNSDDHLYVANFTWADKSWSQPTMLSENIHTSITGCDIKLLPTNVSFIEPTNTLPTMDNISVSEDLLYPSDSQTVTVVGAADADNDTLWLRCCKDMSDTCVPTFSSSICTSGDFDLQGSPYTPTCTFSTGFTPGTEYVRCVLYDLSNYSTVSSTNYTIDSRPPPPTVFLESEHGTYSSSEDLICRTKVYESTGKQVNVTFNWFENDVMVLEHVDTGSYTTNALVNMTLDAGNLSDGENWTCSVRTYNGEYSLWVNSTQHTIAALPDYVPLSNTSITKAMMTWVSDDLPYGTNKYLSKYALTKARSIWQSWNVTDNSSYYSSYNYYHQPSIAIRKNGDAVLLGKRGDNTDYLFEWNYNLTNNSWYDYDGDSAFYSPFNWMGVIDIFGDEVLFATSRSTSAAPYYTSSSDGALTWSAMQEIDATYDSEGYQLTPLVFLSDGDALLLFKDDDSPYGYLSSLWNGSSWSLPQYISSNNYALGFFGQSDLASYQDADAWAIWSDFDETGDPVYVARWNGSVWSDSQSLDTNSNYIHYTAPRIACSSGGYCLAVWPDTSYNLEYSFFDGIQWSSADQDIGSGVDIKRYSRFDLAVDSNGDALLCYIDDDDGDIYVTEYNVSVNSWGAPQEVSDDVNDAYVTGDMTGCDIKLFEASTTIPANFITPVSTVSLSSTSEGNFSDGNLNCSGTLIDVENQTMNVTVRWYKNDSLNLTVPYNNDYADGYAFSALLLSGNTTENETWNCSLQVTDGIDISIETISDALTINGFGSLSLNHNITFVNWTTAHTFNATAGVVHESGASSLKNTSVSYAGGSCSYLSNETNGNYFNVTYNCTGTPYTTASMNITFCDVVDACVTTPTSSNNYPNQAPSMGSLLTPMNNNETVHAIRPEFTWSSGNDPEGDTINYTINITHDIICQPGPQDSTLLTSYTPSFDFCPDSLKNYTWKVRACDEWNCSDWHETWQFTLEPYVEISLVDDALDFGSLSISDSEDTSDGSPAPFRLRNDGNVYASLVNITAQDSLWASAIGALGTSYTRFKAREVASETGSFDTGTSIMSWTNLDNTNQSVIDTLNHTNTNDEAYIDIEITVPSDEPPGSKSTNIIFTWEQTPYYTN